MEYRVVLATDALCNHEVLSFKVPENSAKISSLARNGQAAFFVCIYAIMPDKSVLAANNNGISLESLVAASVQSTTTPTPTSSPTPPPTPVNYPPGWTSTIGTQWAIQGQAFDLQVRATDPNSSDVVTYSFDLAAMDCDKLTWSPALAISATTGEITGTPANVTDVVTCSVKVLATSTGTTISQSFSIVLYPAAPAGFSCTGGGTLATTCLLTGSQLLAGGSILAGPGSIELQSGGVLSSNLLEKISIKMGGHFSVKSGGQLKANTSLLQASSITIEAGGVIDASAMGYGANGGPGTGSENYNGGGGGYGGLGGWGGSNVDIGGPTYGSIAAPVDYGSGGFHQAGWDGNDYVGGAGGGAIRLSASGPVTVNGSILANGGNSSGTFGSYGAGGGSGGSVWITADSIAGSGTIAANGGNPTATGGWGGGGRIAWQVTSTSFSGTISYESGPSTPAFHPYASMGVHGTFATSVANPCTTGSLANGCTVSQLVLFGSQPVTYSAASLTIASGGEIRSHGNLGSVTLTVSSLVVQSGGKINTNLNLNADSLTVASGGSIEARGKGYRGGYRGDGGRHQRGSGKGTCNYSCGGSSYGGLGGLVSALAQPGSTYGDKFQPADYGTGGAGAYLHSGCYAGDGGGKMRLIVSGTATVSGIIGANGTNAEASGCNYGGAGGSGGSVWVTAGALEGTGQIQSVGALNSNMGGGAGGGGRISLEYTSGSFSAMGTTSAAGGSNSAGGVAGSPGSICFNGGGAGC